MAFTPDRKDLQLMALLCEDAELTNAKLGKQLHLDMSAVSRRIKRLRKEGYITGYQARVNYHKLGFMQSVVLFVYMDEDLDLNDLSERRALYALCIDKIIKALKPFEHRILDFRMFQQPVCMVHMSYDDAEEAFEAIDAINGSSDPVQMTIAHWTTRFEDGSYEDFHDLWASRYIKALLRRKD